MAKGIDTVYHPDRRAMSKVKHERDCDCVVAGFRWYRNSERLGGSGSLLLGLYDDSETLQGSSAFVVVFPSKKDMNFVEYPQTPVARMPFRIIRGSKRRMVTQGVTAAREGPVPKAAGARAKISPGSLFDWSW